jgi:hypothetical protein
MTTFVSTRRARFGRAARVAVATGLLVAAALGLSASPSSADPPGTRPSVPLAQIQLILTPAGEAVPGTPAVDVGSGAATATETVTLTCTPDGGTHPTAREACGSLRRVNGDFFRLPDVPAFCPDIYDPHVALARGFWKSSPGGRAVLVSYSETFPNRCAAAVGTDNVFRF